MFKDEKENPLWTNKKQLKDYLEYGCAEGKTTGFDQIAGILVRKVEGEIVVVAGSQRMETMLREFGEAKVRFSSGRETTVVRAPHGQLVEK